MVLQLKKNATMLIDLTEDTLADLISQNEKLSYNILPLGAVIVAS
jgi:hypothetical protein